MVYTEYVKLLICIRTVHIVFVPGELPDMFILAQIKACHLIGIRKSPEPMRTCCQSSLKKNTSTFLYMYLDLL